VTVSKIFGLHEVELRAGADPGEYERFLAEEMAPLPMLPGWRAHLLRGERGEREGRFAVLYEVESIEGRDRYFPAAEQPSEEFRRYLEQHPDVARVMAKSEEFESGERVTDYRVIATSPSQ
jgi:hypothetical protein